MTRSIASINTVAVYYTNTNRQTINAIRVNDEQPIIISNDEQAKARAFLAILARQASSGAFNAPIRSANQVVWTRKGADHGVTVAPALRKRTTVQPPTWTKTDDKHKRNRVFVNENGVLAIRHHSKGDGPYYYQVIGQQAA